MFDFTVRQVIDRADVARQTFYRSFTSKDDLLLAVFRESLADGVSAYVAEVAQASARDRLHHLVTRPFTVPVGESGRRMLRWRARERQRLIEEFPESVEAVYEPYREALRDAILALRENGEVTCDDPDLTATAVLHLVQSLTHAVHGGGIVTDPEEMAEIVWDLTWYGLANRGRRRRRL